MSQPDTFVIIDGNSLMHRAFHALPPLSNADGVYTNAVFGFLSMLFKVVGDEQPRYLAVAFDLHGPTFRHKDYSEYKAGRKPTAPELRPQFDLVRECLEKMGVKILTCPTFEADDARKRAFPRFWSRATAIPCSWSPRRAMCFTPGAA